MCINAAREDLLYRIYFVFFELGFCFVRILALLLLLESRSWVSRLGLRFFKHWILGLLSGGLQYVCNAVDGMKKLGMCKSF